MIVVDSSALLAILLGEPEQQAFENIIAYGDRCVTSAVNAHETATVLRLRHGPAAVAQFWRWLAERGKAFTPRRASIFPIVRPTRWPKAWTRRCSSKGMTSLRPT